MFNFIGIVLVNLWMVWILIKVLVFVGYCIGVMK